MPPYSQASGTVDAANRRTKGLIDVETEYASWSEYIQSVTDPAKVAWTCKRSSQDKGNATWNGTNSFEDAVRMATRDGWPEGRELLSQSLAIVAPRPEPYRAAVFDVAGAFPLVPLWVAGEPASMMDFPADSVIATQPVVRIDYNNWVSAFVTKESIMLRGAAVVSLCDQLERRGYSVELRIVGNSRAGKYAFRSSIVYKRAGTPLDLDRAAFAIAHPSSLRRLAFAQMEQHAELQHDFHIGYGRPMLEPNDPRPDTIFIPGPSSQETPQSARLAVEIAAKAYLIDQEGD